MGKRSRTLAALLMLLFVLHGLGGVNFEYWRWVDNDPLPNADAVVRVEPDRLVFADGKVVAVAVDAVLQADIDGSDGRLGRGPADSDGSLILYGRHRTFVCGNSYFVFTIPLVPVDRPRYTWHIVGIGRLVSPANPAD